MRADSRKDERDHLAVCYFRNKLPSKANPRRFIVSKSTGDSLVVLRFASSLPRRHFNLCDTKVGRGNAVYHPPELPGPTTEFATDLCWKSYPQLKAIDRCSRRGLVGLLFRAECRQSVSNLLCNNSRPGRVASSALRSPRSVST